MTFRTFLSRVIQYWAATAATGDLSKTWYQPGRGKVDEILVQLWERQNAIASGSVDGLSFINDDNILRVEGNAFDEFIGDVVKRPFRVFRDDEQFGRGIRRFAESDDRRQWRKGHLPDLASVEDLIKRFAEMKPPLDVKNDLTFVGTLVIDRVRRGVILLGFKDLTDEEAVQFGKSAHATFDLPEHRLRRGAQGIVQRAPAEEPWEPWLTQAEDRYHFRHRLEQEDHFAPFVCDLLVRKFAATQANGDVFVADDFTLGMLQGKASFVVTTGPTAIPHNLPTSDWLCICTPGKYEEIAESLYDSLPDDAPSVLVADTEILQRWTAPYPDIWSKHLGTDASFHIVRADEESRLQVLLGAEVPGSDSSITNLAVRIRIIARTGQLLANTLYGTLLTLKATVLLLRDGIDRVVLRIAQDCMLALRPEHVIIVVNDLHPQRAPELFIAIRDLADWLKIQLPKSSVGVLIGHTPSTTIDAQQPWLERRGFSKPILVE